MAENAVLIKVDAQKEPDCRVLVIQQMLDVAQVPNEMLLPGYRLHSIMGRFGGLRVPLGLDVTEAARRLSLSRPAFSRVLNGRAGISPDLAVRLEQAGVGTARAWMQLQANYELSLALARKQPPIIALGTA